MSGSKTLIGTVCLAVILSGCATNTVPPPAEPTDPIRHNRLEVPAWLEIISVDFAAAMHGGDQKRARGRGFFTVFGRHRESGKYHLLLYEDISRRVEPIEIIAVNSTVASDSIGIEMD